MPGFRRVESETMNRSDPESGRASKSGADEPFQPVPSIDTTLVHLLSNLQATESRLEYLEAVLEEQIQEARDLRRVLEQEGGIQTGSTQTLEPSGLAPERETQSQEGSPAPTPAPEAPTGDRPSTREAIEAAPMAGGDEPETEPSEQASPDAAERSETDRTWIVAAVIVIVAVLLLVLLIATH
jgi:cobalamin biosynthesis Mg chelatase CobN